MTPSSDNDPKLITISIDGEDFDVDDRAHTPRELLALAGLDPDTSYLIELRGQQQESFQDRLDETIKLHNKQRFISADTGSAPVA